METILDYTFLRAKNSCVIIRMCQNALTFCTQPIKQMWSGCGLFTGMEEYGLIVTH